MISVRTLVRTLTGRALVCDACQRDVDYVRGSMWHGQDRICRECFTQWYDPDNGTFDPNDKISLGNYVRSKHGLPPLPVERVRRTRQQIFES